MGDLRISTKPIPVGTDEIARGTTLPVGNPSNFDQFIVEGSSVPQIPDGTYAWNNGAWVQT